MAENEPQKILSEQETVIFTKILQQPWHQEIVEIVFDSKGEKTLRIKTKSREVSIPWDKALSLSDEEWGKQLEEQG